MTEPVPLPAAPPWARLPDEPPRWFARFEAYRALGPERTLIAAYRATQGRNRPDQAGTGRPPATAPGTWREAARRWRWAERAAAWDAHVLAEQARVLDQLAAQEALAARRARWALLAALRVRLAPLLAAPAAEPLPPRAAYALALRLVEALRAEFEPPAPQRHLVGSDPQQPVVVELRLQPPAEHVGPHTPPPDLAALATPPAEEPPAWP